MAASSGVKTWRRASAQMLAGVFTISRIAAILGVTDQAVYLLLRENKPAVPKKRWRWTQQAKLRRIIHEEARSRGCHPSVVAAEWGYQGMKFYYRPKHANN